MLDPKIKSKIIKKYQTHVNDTGSSQVQIAILSEEIKDLTEHLKLHKKDHSSRRGLLKKVNERRKLLKYLAKDDPAGFEDISKKLKLKIKTTMQEKSVEDIEKELERQRLEKEEWEKLAESQKTIDENQ